MTRKNYNKKNITKKKKMKGGGILGAIGEVASSVGDVPLIIKALDELQKIVNSKYKGPTAAQGAAKKILDLIVSNDIIIQELLKDVPNDIIMYKAFKEVLLSVEKDGTKWVFILCDIVCKKTNLIGFVLKQDKVKNALTEISVQLEDLRDKMGPTIIKTKLNENKNITDEEKSKIFNKLMEMIKQTIQLIQNEPSNFFNYTCSLIKGKGVHSQITQGETSNPTTQGKPSDSQKPQLYDAQITQGETSNPTTQGKPSDSQKPQSETSNLTPTTKGKSLYAENSKLSNNIEKIDVTVDEKITVIDLMEKIVDKFSSLKQFSATLLKQSVALQAKSPEAATALGQLGKKIDAEKNIVKETIEKIELFIEIFGNQHIRDAFNSIDANLDTEQIVIIKSGEANKVSTFSCLYNKDCFVDHIGNEPEGTDKEIYQKDKYAKFEYLIDNRNIMSDDLRSKFLLLRKLFNDNDKIKSQKGKLKDLCNMKNEIKEKLLGFLNSISEPMQKIRGDILNIPESQEILNVVDEVLKTFIEIQKLIEVKIKMIDTEIPQLKVACIIFRKWSILNNIPDDNSKESTAFEKMGCLIASTERACDYKLKGGKGKKTQKRSRSKRHK